MAVYEYTGVFASSGKATKGVRDADNEKVLRAALRREGVMLTGAHEDSGKARAAGRGETRDRHLRDLQARQHRRRRRHDAPAGDAAERGHSAGRVDLRAHRTAREKGPQAHHVDRARAAQRRHQLRASARGPRAGISAALHQHGRRRRGLGLARSGARATRRLHGGAGPLEGQGRRRARIPDPHDLARHRAHVGADGRGRAEGDEHLPEPRSGAALVHAAADRGVGFSRRLLVARHHDSGRRQLWLQALERLRKRAATPGTRFC